MKYINEILFLFQLHVSTDSEVPDHCCRFGLSSKEKNFTSKCVHSHHLKCDDCEMLSETLKTIEEAIDTITFPNSDEKDDAKYVISQVNHLYKIKGIAF